MKHQIDTTSPEETEQLAEKIGARLKGGEVIELVSDLGGGKTTLVRGLARGLGSRDVVASPTFTISKVYASSQLELHHFDFYRLNDAGLMQHELHDVVGDPKVVVAVEWGDVARHVLPKERVTISLTRTGDTSRQLVLQVPAKLHYLTRDMF